MVMTKADIIAEYNQSKDHRKQITILADQNLVSEQDVVDILLAGGCDVPMGYKYRKRPTGTANRPPKKKAIKKEDLIDMSPSLMTETINKLIESKSMETVTETIPRSMATRMIVEKAAMDVVRDFVNDKEKTWDELCLYMGGVVDLVCLVGKRCG